MDCTVPRLIVFVELMHQILRGDPVALSLVLHVVVEDHVRLTGKDTQKTDAPMGAAGQRMGVQRPTEMRISS